MILMKFHLNNIFQKALNPVVAQSRFHEFRDLNQKNVM